MVVYQSFYCIFFPLLEAVTSRLWVLKGEKQASLLFLLPPFDYSYPIDTRWRINFVRHFYEYKKTKNCITKKRASGFRTCNVMS